MATYHLSLKNGAKGKGGPHALYIMRLGKFSKGAKGQQVIASGEINLPYWAKTAMNFSEPRISMNGQTAEAIQSLKSPCLTNCHRMKISVL